jgi:hypothetical protein
MFDHIVSGNHTCGQSVTPTCDSRVVAGLIVAALKRKQHEKLDQVEELCVTSSKVQIYS